MKPGWKSTEFLVTVGVQIVGLLLTLGIFTPEQAGAMEKAIPQLGGMAAMLVASFGYSISRGEAKKGEAIGNGKKIEPTISSDIINQAKFDVLCAQAQTEIHIQEAQKAKRKAYESRIPA